MLDDELVQSELATRGSTWTDVQVVAATGSTNKDLLADLAEGKQLAEGLTLATTGQQAGRGRFDRTWLGDSPGSLALSTVTRVPPVALSGLPIVIGVGLATALVEFSDQPLHLKWPNDVVNSLGKVGGILIEIAGGAQVVGCGVNLADVGDDISAVGGAALSTAPANSQLAAEALAAVITQFSRVYERWQLAGFSLAASGLRDQYIELCATLGQEVIVTQPNAEIRGRALEIDESGALLVGTAEGAVRVDAGDVTHLRPS